MNLTEGPICHLDPWPGRPRAAKKLAREVVGLNGGQVARHVRDHIVHRPAGSGRDRSVLIGLGEGV